MLLFKFKSQLCGKADTLKYCNTARYNLLCSTIGMKTNLAFYLKRFKKKTKIFNAVAKQIKSQSFPGALKKLHIDLVSNEYRNFKLWCTSK